MEVDEGMRQRKTVGGEGKREEEEFGGDFVVPSKETDSLLGSHRSYGGSSSSSSSSSPPPSPSEPNIFQQFGQFIWLKILFLPNTFPCLLPFILSLMGHERTPEVENRMRSEIEKMKEHITACYDASSETHEKCLRILWEMAFPSRKLPSRETKEWQDLGFQGKDPATDFRGGGIFGLCNLLFLGRRYPASFQTFVTSRSYPFAIAGLQLTNVLFECLGFGMKASNNIVVNKHIAHLLFFDQHLSRSPSAIQKEKPLWGDAFAQGERDAVTHFNFLFSYLFFILDEVWVEMKASYMDFPRVLEKTREKFEKQIVTKNMKDVEILNNQHETSFILAHPLLSSSSSPLSPSSPALPPLSPLQRQLKMNFDEYEGMEDWLLGKGKGKGKEGEEEELGGGEGYSVFDSSPSDLEPF